MSECVKYYREKIDDDGGVTLRVISLPLEHRGAILTLNPDYRDPVEDWWTYEQLMHSRPSGFWFSLKLKLKVFFKTGKWLNAQIRVREYLEGVRDMQGPLCKERLKGLLEK